MAEFKSTISSQDFDKALQGGLDYAADKSGIWEALENAGGLTDTEKAFMLTLFKNAAYTADVSATITKLEALWSGSEEPDEPIEPDDPDIPVVNTYTVTNTLTNVTNSNTAASVTEGASYTATLTADEGYNIDSVTVTVGGVDVTASVYANGVVSISNVSGNIVITATAVEIPVEDDENNGWADGVAYTINWTDGYKIDNSAANETFGEAVENASMSVSDFLPCRGVSAMMLGTGVYANYGIYFYDENKTLLQRTIAQSDAAAKAYPTPAPLGAYYCRVQCKTTDKETATVTPVKFAILSETTSWEAGEYYNLSYTEGGTLNSNTGAVTTNANYFVSDYAFCYGATKVDALTNMTTYRTTMCFYDESKNFISGSTVGNSDWEVPEGAKYFRHACYNGDQFNNGGGMNNPWFVLT